MPKASVILPVIFSSNTSLTKGLKVLSSTSGLTPSLNSITAVSTASSNCWVTNSGLACFNLDLGKTSSAASMSPSISIPVSSKSSDPPSSVCWSILTLPPLDPTSFKIQD